MRATPARSALAYERRDKLAENTFKHSFTIILKLHSRDATKTGSQKRLTQVSRIHSAIELFLLRNLRRKDQLP